MEHEKILANHIAHKWLIFKIYQKPQLPIAMNKKEPE